MSTSDPTSGDIVSSENMNQNQYLTFLLGEEEYGVDILRVQEIRGWDSVTTIPNSPAFIKGVINLRGTIVSILDLRERFGIESVEYDDLTVVVVLRVKSEDSDKDRIMGVVVDAVSEVYHISEEELKDAPDLGYAINMDYMKGMATIDDKMIIVLDIDHLMSLKDIDAMEKSGKALTED
ncbi:MAG: chemotaxis protein CheW [Cycloclasticus sp. symbiont of Bathymodiolus heckerae]|nr:MAG: chemotaxis protein CheW [Cycloclasticus sp. symbiont of Bathymodiolus heckerae]